jgi:hypothetical protein
MQTIYFEQYLLIPSNLVKMLRGGENRRFDGTYSNSCFQFTKLNRIQQMQLQPNISTKINN